MKCKISKVKIHNFLSFADEEYDFSSKSGITTIIGVNDDIPGAANGCGKTALVTAIFYVLFGKDGVKTKNKFLKNRYVDSNEYWIQLFVEIDGKNFKIERGSIGTESYLKMFTISNGVEQNITKASIFETEAALKRTLSNITPDIFLKTVLLSPALGKNFFGLSPKEKMEFLNMLSGTKRIYDINDLVVKDMNNLNTEIKIIDNSLMSLSKQIESLEEKKKDFIAKHEELKKIHDEKTAELNEKIQKDTESIKTKTEEFNQRESERIKLANELEKLQEEQSKIKIKLVAKASEAKSLQDKNEQMKKFIDKNTALRNLLCEKCKPRVDELLNIGVLTSHIDENNAKIDKLKSELLEIQSKKDDGNGIKELSSKLRNLQDEVNALNVEIRGYRNSIESNKYMLETIDNNYKKVDEIEPFSDLIESDKKEIEEKSDKRDSLTKERQKLAIIKFMTDDEIIHKFVISQFAKDINLYISKYLSAMGVNYTVVFDNNLTYSFMTQSGEMSYELFSSGEKMRLNIATSFAFRKLLFKYLNIDINLLVLDEYVDSALDRLAISGIINLLNEIKLENDFYNIYVISHRSEVLSEFGGNQLIVRKTNGISHIES